MPRIVLHAIRATSHLAGPVAAVAPSGSSPRSVVLLTTMLIMVMLTMRLVARAVKPVVEVVRAAVAVVGAALLLTGLGILLIAMLVA